MHNNFLRVESLTATAFAPFGEVVETNGRSFHYINSKMVERYNDLAIVDVEEDGGRTGISLLVAQPYKLPLRIEFVERHPKSSQAFIPLSDKPFLVIVAPPGEAVPVSALRAFITDGRQGVNYRRGVWHHVLLAINEVAPFVAVDRIGAGPNCDKFSFAQGEQPTVSLTSMGSRATQ